MNQSTDDIQLLQTPLNDWHRSHGGRMVDFAGWSMPVQYGSIMEEHHQTRNAVGLFDVSHMGRLYFLGENAEGFLEGLSTRRIAGIKPGQIRYSFVTNDSGGILDDVLVYCRPVFPKSERESVLPDDPWRFLIVVNASNRDKLNQWIQTQADQRGIDIECVDRTRETAMIAVQGPLANRIVAHVSQTDPDSLGYFSSVETNLLDNPVLLTRTGYTGEDGCELIVDAEHAAEIWMRLNEMAVENNGGAAGLAARDTLRLEAAMPLYGHELSEDINPAQTRLSFATNIKNRQFPGRNGIAAARKNPDLPVRVGLELEGRRPARENCGVLSGDRKIGTVTSGTFSPTLQKSISMAYIDPAYSETGTQVTIDIRGKSHTAKVVELPFYKRNN